MRRMQRRDFLRLLGLSAAAAAVAPSTLVQAASDPDPVSLSRYAVATSPGSWKTAFVLEAPAGRLCRAQIIVPESAPSTVNAYVTGVLSGNAFSQVVIERVAGSFSSQDGEPMNMLAGEVDAYVLNTMEHCCPVDWGAITRDRALEIDYRSLDPEQDQTLLLALFYEVRDTRHPWPPGYHPGRWPTSVVPTGTAPRLPQV